MSKKNNLILCILGPTASGKTAVSLEVAERLPKVEIISADSLAVYKYLNIGTAKPPEDVRRRVPHHLVDFLDPKERWSAYDFRKEALRLLHEITFRESLPVVVGGTAFYLDVLLHGIPTWGAPRRENLRRVLERMRTEQLFALLVSIDPNRAEKVGRSDRKRLIRALEIFFLTGRIPSTKRTCCITLGNFQYLLVGIAWEKEELQKRIWNRIEDMFRKGIVEEVAQLFNLGYELPLPALENFTYRPIIALLQGKCSLREAKEAVFRGTMLFAKRQINWFRKMPVVWISPEEGDFGKLAERVYYLVKTSLEEGHDCGGKTTWED
ncbi:MAG: tRNA (adenosine(37)-N6)-dimethylallyltransferase MiaA [Candidatus Caldatribacterium sp.]|nr:tRNA (adenosine(37)-N6)-dimethylallyltransferase MiaA [Candidatus Caldatribacterium sp.]